MRRRIQNHNVGERLGQRLINRSEFATGMYHYRPSTYRTTTIKPEPGVVNMEIEVDDYQPTELSLQIVDRLMILKGERVDNVPLDTNPLVETEKSQTRFEKVWELAGEADVDRVVAQIKDGVLCIRLYPQTEDSKEQPVCRLVTIAV